MKVCKRTIECWRLQAGDMASLVSFEASIKKSSEGNRWYNKKLSLE